jgi:hypothetical protein
MILDAIASFLGANKICGGVIVEKRHYAPTTETDLPGDVIIAASDESWSLIVRGTGRFGGATKQEVYVEQMDWNNAKVGDAWPAPMKALSR